MNLIMEPNNLFLIKKKKKILQVWYNRSIIYSNNENVNESLSASSGDHLPLVQAN